MKLIPLTQGEYAIVDKKDFNWLSQWKWFCWEKNKNGQKYAYRGQNKNGIHFPIQMHREILNAKKGQICDHINRNGLDNRRKNLRFASYSQNAMNRRKNLNNTSGIKDLYYDKENKKWRIQIRANNKFFSKRFEEKKEAIKFLKKILLKLHGEFSCL